MKEGFERIGINIFKKDISPREKEALIKKTKAGELLSENGDISIEEAVTEVEEKNEFLLGKKKKIMPQEISLLIKNLDRKLQERMQLYADTAINLDREVEQEVAKSEFAFEKIPEIQKNASELRQELELALSYLDEEVEQTPQYHQRLQQLHVLQKQIEVLSQPTVDENTLMIQEKLADLYRKTSEQLHQIISPTDSQLN